MIYKHYSVLLSEALNALEVKKGGKYIDGTLGGGGHARAILEKGGSVLGIDRDIAAIEYNQRFTNENLRLVHGNFFCLEKIAFENQDFLEGGIDGIILDLGFSSYQVDNFERGFSYMGDGGLDMRMDRSEKLTAERVINEYSEEELLKILYNYGEEKNAKKIVRAIVAQRQVKRIKTTKELSELVKSCFPPFWGKGHPAKKTFQAVRIEVNNELTGLKAAINRAFNLLKIGGRLAVISFHSLEDRIVKQLFSSLQEGCRCPKSLPMCICGRVPSGKSIVKKLRPSEQELKENSRSKSATLRVIQRIKEGKL